MSTKHQLQNNMNNYGKSSMSGSTAGATLAGHPDANTERPSILGKILDEQNSVRLSLAETVERIKNVANGLLGACPDPVGDKDGGPLGGTLACIEWNNQAAIQLIGQIREQLDRLERM